MDIVVVIGLAFWLCLFVNGPLGLAVGIGYMAVDYLFLGGNGKHR